MKIIGAVSRVPGRAAALARAAANASVRGATGDVESLFNSDQVAVFVVRRREEGDAALTSGVSTNGEERFWFVGENLCDGERSDGECADIAKAVEKLRQSIAADFVGVRVMSDGTVRLYTDPWGLSWIFVRRLSDAVVFASDFRALCAADPSPLTVDTDAALLELTMGYVADRATIFREIVFAEPGVDMRIDAEGFRVASQHRFEYTDRWARASTAEKFAQLDLIYEGIAQRFAALARGPATISLSAGLDSRYALAFLARMGKAGQLLTFGEAESDEVIDARSIARVALPSAQWSCFPIPASDFDAWRSMIQSLGNGGIVQWCGWADEWMKHVRARSDHCITGYLGDASTGKRFDQIPAYDTAVALHADGLDLWARRWVAWELDMGEWAQSPLLRPEAASRLRPIAGAHFSSMLAWGRFAQPHQSAHHCNLVGRQRRWVGTQSVLMSQYVRPLPWFADRALHEFWTGVALEDLHGQALYNRYAQDRFPKLFPKAPSGAGKFARRVVNKIRREVGALAGKGPPVRRPPPIIKGKLLAGHQDAICELLDRSEPIVDELFDVARVRTATGAATAGATTQGLTPTMLIRAVNLMHLVDLRDAARRAG